MVFATKYEELLSILNEDAAVFVRATVLPEEGAPPKLSIQDLVKLEDARVDLPSLISIRIWLKDESSREKATALNELFVRKRGETEVRLRLEKARDFSVIMDVASKVEARQGIPRRTRKNMWTRIPGDIGDLIMAEDLPLDEESNHDAVRRCLTRQERQRKWRLVDPSVTNPSWQRVQLARHPKRPHSRDYIDRLITGFEDTARRPAFRRR